MEHKAFVFDYQSFIKELAKILDEALKTGENEALVGFIEENAALLKDPYEGKPLDASWRELIEIEDVNQYGDFALTKFYNPQEDIGLGYDWVALQELLEIEGLKQDIVLGEVFGSEENCFDPGKQGAYFQSSEQVSRNLQVIKNLIKRKPKVASELSQLLDMLQQASEVQKGLYITF
jgi:hypothetical protein